MTSSNDHAGPTQRNAGQPNMNYIHTIGVSTFISAHGHVRAASMDPCHGECACADVCCLPRKVLLPKRRHLNIPRVDDARMIPYMLCVYLEHAYFTGKKKTTSTVSTLREFEMIEGVSLGEIQNREQTHEGGYSRHTIFILNLNSWRRFCIL